MTPAPRPWLDVVALHPDVTAKEFSEDIFALDLGPLAAGAASVPAVYRDAEQFFRVSYLTQGLRSLLEDTLSRLAGGGGNRVMKLVTPFGGGKSHALAALLHAARSRAALDAIPEAGVLARPGVVRTAVFDGQFFDAIKGKQPRGESFHARTMWGWMAWSLGGRAGYDLLREQDEARVAPGADEIIKLLGAGPNLVLLDEVLNYLISAGGIPIHGTTLRDETLAFLQRLTAAAGNSANSVLVFSLQSSKRESLEYTNLLETVDHLAARKDQMREPVAGDEVLAVIRRRLLAREPGAGEATAAAAAYQDTVTRMRRAHAGSMAEREAAESEGLALRDRIRLAYPFHPALVDLMRERWAAIPDFQRTRGALRFLAACLRAAHRAGRSGVLLGPGDVPLEDAEVRLALFKEVGRQADFQAVLEHDLTGANARARRIDERRARESGAGAGERAAARLATAILLYSFGGLQRASGGGELLPPGISEPELLQACVGPGLDSTTALACLKELHDTCLYLHFDGVRYCFKKDPNVTLLVEQEAEAVGRADSLVGGRIRERLDERIATSPSARNAYLWPGSPGDVPDRLPQFLLAYMPLAFAAQPRAEKERIALEYFENCGAGKRSYRNGLGLAVPAAAEVEGLRRSVRYLIAIERVQQKAREHNLSDSQNEQLREKRRTAETEIEAAFLKLYPEVWLPKVDGGSLAVEPVSSSGLAVSPKLDEQKHARIHERLVEMLDYNRRVFRSLQPAKIVELFRLGQGDPPTLGIGTAAVRDGFFSFPGFTRLWDEAPIREAIAKGVQAGLIAYCAGPAPALASGKFAVAPGRARCGAALAADEIDLDGGFLMLPQALPAAAAESAPGSGFALTPDPQVPPAAPAPEAGVAPAPMPPGAGRSPVDIELRGDRNALYEAWKAIANLADIAGEVTVRVHAEPGPGTAPERIENAVLEPLREAGLIE